MVSSFQEEGAGRLGLAGLCKAFAYLGVLQIVRGEIHVASPFDRARMLDVSDRKGALLFHIGHRTGNHLPAVYFVLMASPDELLKMARDYRGMSARAQEARESTLLKMETFLTANR
jgi:hypothetical protein